MLTLAAAQAISGQCNTVNGIQVTIFGMELSSGVESYKILNQAYITTSVSALYTAPTSTTSFIKTIILTNATASPVSSIVLVSGSWVMIPNLTLPAYSMALWDDNGLKVYDQNGNLLQSYSGLFSTTVPQATTPIAVSTTGTSINAARVDHTHQSPGGLATLTATSAAINTSETILLSATLPSNFLQVGTMFRAILSGTCTATVANTSTIKFHLGSNNSTADAVVASVAAASATSGTNVPFLAELLVTVRTTGSGGTAVSTSVLLNNGVTGISSSASPVVNAVTTPVGVNTTIQLFVNISYVSPAATTTSTFYNGVLELVKM